MAGYLSGRQEGQEAIVYSLGGMINHSLCGGIKDKEIKKERERYLKTKFLCNYLVEFRNRKE